jgi:hypothetical protein
VLPFPATIHYFIGKTLAVGAITSVWVNPANSQIQPGYMVQETVISSSHPIFQSVDQRVKISVETHLPMGSNTSILDEKEGIDRSIAEAYFESRLQNQIRFDEEGNLQNMTMESKMFSGQYNFIKKSQQNFQWNRLSTAYEIKLFRFQIYIFYRVWNDTTRSWVLQRSKLTVTPQQFWSLSVRFVSDS